MSRGYWPRQLVTSKKLLNRCRNVLNFVYFRIVSDSFIDSSYCEYDRLAVFFQMAYLLHSILANKFTNLYQDASQVVKLSPRLVRSVGRDNWVRDQSKSDKLIYD